MGELDKVVCLHNILFSPFKWLSCWFLLELERLETGRSYLPLPIRDWHGSAQFVDTTCG